MKKTLSIKEQMFLLKVVSGITWIVAGVFGYFENIAATVVVALAMLVSIFCLVRVMAAKREMSDEMSDQHFAMAQSEAMTKLHWILCVFALVLMLVEALPVRLSINWHELLISVFFIIIGLSNLFTGFTFKRLEEA